MMRHGNMSRRVFSHGVLGSVACVASGAARADSGELRVGLTPVFLTSDIELLERLKAYLERSTAQPVQLVTRRTYQEITALLISGQLEAAWICGYPFVAYREQLELVAVPIWRGRPLYQSYLIVDRDRRAEGIDDLKGDIHAFSDPDSNSGFLVTATLLAKRGLTPEAFFRKTFYTYGHRNVVRAVAAGLADSGSVDGYVWEVLQETEPSLTTRTRIATRSPWLGFPPIATSKEKSASQALIRLQEAFVSMATVPEGRAVLQLLRLDGFAVEDPSLFDTIAAEMHIVRGDG
jgi:phosphonate transport system substrate-binding protein